MRKLLCVSVLIALVLACKVDADIVSERKREGEVPILGMTIRAYSATFKKNEPARVLASGNYASNFGLYVFDANGNCVAKDDVSDPATADDCFAVWIPPEQQGYAVEVRNAGIDPNVFQIALR
jgi:hypothetical protein